MTSKRHTPATRRKLLASTTPDYFGENPLFTAAIEAAVATTLADHAKEMMQRRDQSNMEAAGVHHSPPAFLQN
jgi:hypothetical protein